MDGIRADVLAEVLLLLLFMELMFHLAVLCVTAYPPTIHVADNRLVSLPALCPAGGGKRK